MRHKNSDRIITPPMNLCPLKLVGVVRKLLEHQRGRHPGQVLTMWIKSGVTLDSAVDLGITSASTY
jgi:hypothetical protein